MGFFGTFWGWRGAHHGKRTARNTAALVGSNAAMLDHMRRAELVERGLIAFNATDGEVARVEADLARQRRDATRVGQGSVRETLGGEPLEPWQWWTLLAFTVAVGATLVGLVLAVPMGVVLYLRHPFGTAPVCAMTDPDATRPLPTVPDPVGLHDLRQWPPSTRDGWRPVGTLGSAEHAPPVALRHGRHAR